MLQIQNLTIVHRQDNRPLLEDFTFSLQKGDKAVIIGEEGNGKSTLLRYIADPTLIESYAEATGNVLTSGLILGYLPQSLPEEDARKTVYEFFADEPNFWTEMPRELSASLGFDPDLFYSDQKLGTLSGGEKVKIQMARILLQQPDVLLLDEPSGDLDLTSLEWLETFIGNAPQPVLFISHDETLIERTADVIIHLEMPQGGRVLRHTICRQPYSEYIAARQAGIEKQTQLAHSEERDYQKQMQRFYQIQQKVEHQLRTITRQDPAGGRLLKKKMKAVKSQQHRFEKAHENQTQVPHVELAILAPFDPSIKLPAGKCVLDLSLSQLALENRTLAKDLSLRVMGGEKICIIGKNGCGKTTLMKQIAAQLLPRADIQTGYMPQNYTDQLNMQQTPLEFLASTGTKEETTKIRTYLGSMRYTIDEMFHPIAALSGGQQAKLLFLKMILDGDNVLLLDEPTRNFSPLSGPVIRRVLQDFHGTIISVSHDRKYMEEVCDKVYRLTEEGLVQERD